MLLSFVLPAKIQMGCFGGSKKLKFERIYFPRERAWRLFNMVQVMKLLGTLCNSKEDCAFAVQKVIEGAKLDKETWKELKMLIDQHRIVNSKKSKENKDGFC